MTAIGSYAIANETVEVEYNEAEAPVASVKVLKVESLELELEFESLECGEPPAATAVMTGGLTTVPMVVQAVGSLGSGSGSGGGSGGGTGGAAIGKGFVASRCAAWTGTEGIRMSCELKSVNNILEFAHSASQASRLTPAFVPFARRLIQGWALVA